MTLYLGNAILDCQYRGMWGRNGIINWQLTSNKARTKWDCKIAQPWHSLLVLHHPRVNVCHSKDIPIQFLFPCIHMRHFHQLLRKLVPFYLLQVSIAIGLCITKYFSERTGEFIVGLWHVSLCDRRKGEGNLSWDWDMFHCVVGDIGWQVCCETDISLCDGR
jgi:hypothetical protein